MTHLAADVILAILAGCLAATGLVLWLTRKPGPKKAALPPREQAPASLVFVFDSTGLVDASPEARCILDVSDPDWAAFRAALLPRFDCLPERMETVGDGLALHATHPEDPGELHFTRNGRTLSARLCDRPSTLGERHRLILARAERDQLARMSANSPNPAWRSDPAGTPLWANRAYRKLADRIVADDSQTIPVLFHLPTLEIDNRVLRRRLDVPGQPEPLWYDIRSVRAGNEWMHYAIDVAAVVHAETAQRNFVQSLTRIFAELATGLAIFDRDQRLVMFNPALMDLTSLPVDFLSARPTLTRFFDTLRDRRIMPEPRDYAAWRQSIRQLFETPGEAGASETWAMGSGLTYRVTARPSPDGGVAFLFEDITSEITLARRFRTELDLSQAVLDRLDDAVAVFSPMGHLTLTNAAYRRLWNTDPESGLTETTLSSALRDWQTECKPGIGWASLHEVAEGCGPRDPRQAEIRRKDGLPLIVRTAGLPGGALLVSFHHASDAATGLPGAEPETAGA
ncbi:MAG: PAS-domain containing protein [Paracoccaceae bacterium]